MGATAFSTQRLVYLEIVAVVCRRILLLETIDAGSSLWNGRWRW
jgi:hypothetical protein